MVIEPRVVQFWNQTYDFSPNCTPLSAITIINQRGKVLKKLWWGIKKLFGFTNWVDNVNWPSQWISAVVYFRLKNVINQVHYAFVMEKASPIHEISIPILELTVSVICVRLSRIIGEELEMTADQVYYWTDSASVLKYINFVNSQVSEP